MELVDAGPSTDGNRLIAAVISSPENIARLEEIRAANLRLADPRRIERGRRARRSPATQPGRRRHRRQHSRHGDRRDAGRQRAAAHAGDQRRPGDAPTCSSNVVLILLPSLNPDGHVLTVDWYRKWKGTEFEGAPMPWLYHRYVGHDINRDAFMMNMAENRTLADFFYRRWHPQVFLTMHQMGSRGPRFFVPPNYDPIDPNYDPLIWRTAGLLGHAMALAMEEDGRSGVVQNALYDYYWPGYEDSAPLGHNTVCLLTEVASVRVATPITRRAAELQGTPRGLPGVPRRRSTFPIPGPAATGASATSSTTTCRRFAGCSRRRRAIARSCCRTSTAWAATPSRRGRARRAVRLHRPARISSIRTPPTSSASCCSTARSRSSARSSRFGSPTRCIPPAPISS